MDLSESRLYDVLRELRQLGLTIKFSHLSNSYYYEDDAEIEVSVKGRVLDIKEMENRNGGTDSYAFNKRFNVNSNWRVSTFYVHKYPCAFNPL